MKTIESECPVCGARSRLVKLSSSAAVASRMDAFLGVPGAAAVVGEEYDLLECTACGLQFADPMMEPGVDFYTWLLKVGLDYPESRWEWIACRDYVRQRSQSAGAIRLLDAGCGDGTFLSMVAELPSIEAVGVDHNPDVVAQCRQRGIEAHVGWLNDVPTSNGKFDVVTLWHVVEHVSDPVGTLDQVAKTLLAPGGAICFSVPLSPMSDERVWRDPFNEPPHHLTRWTLSALAALGEKLGMTTSFELPEPDAVVKRMLRGLSRQACDKRRMRSVDKAVALLGLLIRSPAELLHEWRYQRHSRRHDGRSLPDVVMVRLEP